MHTEFFLVGVNAQCDKGDRGILLGIAQVAGWSCCSWSGSSVLEFSFQLDSPIYTYRVGHRYNQSRLARNSTCSGISECNYCYVRGSAPLYMTHQSYQ